MKIINKSTLSALVFAGFAGIATAEVTDVIEKSLEFDSNGKISLSNINGDVSIRACDCTQLSLTATITTSDQATRDRISIDIDASESRFSVETKYAKRDKSYHSRNTRSEVVYELSVPNDVRLRDIDLVNGDLDIRGVTGSLDADLVNGELISDGMTSDTNVSLVNGDMEITFANLDNTDKIKLESVNGDIVVRIPSDANVEVSADTVSGRITNDFGLKVHKGRYVGSDMRGVLGDGSISLSMENVNGKISLENN